MPLMSNRVALLSRGLAMVRAASRFSTCSGGFPTERMRKHSLCWPSNRARVGTTVQPVGRQRVTCTPFSSEPCPVSRLGWQIDRPQPLSQLTARKKGRRIGHLGPHGGDCRDLGSQGGSFSRPVDTTQHGKDSAINLSGRRRQFIRRSAAQRPGARFLRRVSFDDIRPQNSHWEDCTDMKWLMSGPRRIAVARRSSGTHDRRRLEVPREVQGCSTQASFASRIVYDRLELQQLRGRRTGTFVEQPKRREP